MWNQKCTAIACNSGIYGKSKVLFTAKWVIKARVGQKSYRHSLPAVRSVANERQVCRWLTFTSLWLWLLLSPSPFRRLLRHHIRCCAVTQHNKWRFFAIHVESNIEYESQLSRFFDYFLTFGFIGRYHNINKTPNTLRTLAHTGAKHSLATCSSLNWSNLSNIDIVVGRLHRSYRCNPPPRSITAMKYALIVLTLILSEITSPYLSPTFVTHSFIIILQVNSMLISVAFCRLSFALKLHQVPIIVALIVFCFYSSKFRQFHFRSDLFTLKYIDTRRSSSVWGNQNKRRLIIFICVKKVSCVFCMWTFLHNPVGHVSIDRMIRE